jgi:hypothetical protein
MTMEYLFEELPVDIDGHAALFSGTAYLQPDRGGFWVACINLPGVDGNGCPLDRSGSPLARLLDAAICDALYADRHAREAWAAHVEEERADAA